MTPRRRSLCALSDAMALRCAFRSKMGLDIGGTLAKLVITSAQGNHHPLVSLTGSSTILHDELSFVVTSLPGQAEVTLHFLAMHTHRLGEEFLLSLRGRLSWPATATTVRPIVTAGGGAHRFRTAFREHLHVELLPFKELHAVVRGLHFLYEHGPADELFTLAFADGASDGGGASGRASGGGASSRASGGATRGGGGGTSRVAAHAHWPQPLFPFLLINMGSGVSVLRVTSPHELVRVGGTACGGATFLGLARALTGVADFPALMRLAAEGCEERVNKTVGDIYGADGCADLGMPAQMTAAAFGRVATASDAELHQPGHAADLVRALLRMVAQESVVLAKAYAPSVTPWGRVRQQMQDAVTGGGARSGGGGGLERVFFVGGFVGARENGLARQMIAESMESFGGRALFCKHAEFLGALGSLSDCMDRRERQGVGAS